MKLQVCFFSFVLCVQQIQDLDGGLHFSLWNFKYYFLFHIQTDFLGMQVPYTSEHGQNCHSGTAAKRESTPQILQNNSYLAGELGRKFAYVDWICIPVAQVFFSFFFQYVY